MNKIKFSVLTKIDEEIDKLDCNNNIKNFIKEVLRLEYEYRDNERPRVISTYNEKVEKYMDGEENVHQ